MDAKTWNEIISSFPEPHILQSYEWGQIKSYYGWEPIHKVWKDEDGHLISAALILEREIKIPVFGKKLRMLYVPKGPILRDWGDTELHAGILADLQKLARERNAFFLMIDPEVTRGVGEPGTESAKENTAGSDLQNELRIAEWRPSRDQVQFRNTVIVDLTPTEDEILARMKQKTRYNVRLAGRKGVSVRVGGSNDLEMLYRMYAETAVRDRFVIRHKRYYLELWGAFLQSGMLQPLIAEVEGVPVAGLMLFHFGGRAWYLHGMSTGMHRNKMPNYLLQWEAMRLAKAAGCTTYDLWGAPDVFDESDSMWGVYRFKRGLGGEVHRHIGAWDLPLQPGWYWLYTQVLPRILGVMRLFGRRRAAGEAQGGP
ncbi:MAG: peptidoglycan bridge formation glycyltransferase FemA/FemB family protein [Anaerolineae bacterium]|nr:peptidoglycan bridge formation glycyltransferase FemA/FemB family protein [Anaerolineae bacterium]